MESTEKTENTEHEGFSKTKRLRDLRLFRDLRVPGLKLQEAGLTTGNDRGQ
jgi:hypothetical protein